MSNHLATINCEFNQPNGNFVLGTPISGRFLVTPKKDLQYKYISYSVILKIEAIGENTKHERVMHSEHLVGATGDWQQAMTTGSIPYEYPFQFSLQQPTSYFGQYFQLKWFIQFEVEMTNASKKALRQSAIAHLNLQRIIFPSSKIRQRFSFQLNRGRRTMKTLDQFNEVKLDGAIRKYIVPTSIGLVGVIWTWASHIHFAFPIFDIMGATGLGLGLYHSVVGFGRLGRLKFQVMPSSTRGNTFDVKTEIKQNWSKVKKVGVYYKVVEGVKNSESARLSKIQYKEVEVQKNVSSDTTILQIPFPRKNIPPTLTYGDYFVKWKLFVTIYLTNGKASTYDFYFVTQL